MRKHKRIFDGDFMHKGVHLMIDANAKVRDVAPQVCPPMSHIPLQQPAEEPPEILEGHCLKCKGKKSFQVDPERTKTMKSGAVMKQGKCLEPGCNTMMSTFVSGAKDAA